MRMPTRQSDARARFAVGRWRFALSKLCALLLIAAAAAQAPEEAKVFPSRDRTFRIPFAPQMGEARLREVQLYYSTDEGRNWRFHANALPEQGFFQFTAPGDGQYWFGVRTIDVQGRAFPLREADLKAGIKVQVDGQPPRVGLRALANQGTNVGVEWDVRDELLDLATLKLEYLPAGAAQYQQVRIDPVAVGQHFWTPPTGGPLEVRLSVADTAGNIGSEKVIVTAGNGAGGAPANPANPNDAARAPMGAGAPAAPAGPPPVRMVNSKRVSLNYRIEDLGPSGIAALELWYTADGRNWQKYGEYAKPEPPLVFDVVQEGLYGFTLLARSGVGLSDRPPQAGDQPQIWVEVDETRPVVRLLGADVGRGSDVGRLTISWTATDKNLTAQPITLAYADGPDGPWTTIAANQPNTGRYVWNMPQTGTPYRFLVRVEAADKASNVGAAQTANPVIVDLHRPRPTILDVGAAGK